MMINRKISKYSDRISDEHGGQHITDIYSVAMEAKEMEQWISWTKLLSEDNHDLFIKLLTWDHN